MTNRRYGLSFLTTTLLYGTLGFSLVNLVDIPKIIEPKKERVIHVSVVTPPKKVIKKEPIKEKVIKKKVIKKEVIKKKEPIKKKRTPPKKKTPPKKHPKPHQKKSVPKKTIPKKPTPPRINKPIKTVAPKPVKVKRKPPPQEIVEPTIVEQPIEEYYYTPPEPIVESHIVELPPVEEYHSSIVEDVIPYKSSIVEDYVAPPPPPAVTYQEPIEAPLPVPVEEPRIEEPKIEEKYEPTYEPQVVKTPEQPVANQVDNSALRREFLEGLRGQIISNKQYPKKALKRHIEGSVSVRFDLNSNGDAENIRFVNGKRVLQKGVKEAILRTFPLSVPSQLQGELPIYNISVTVHFRIH